MKLGGWILLLIILLMIPTSSAYQYTYLNNLSLTDAKNDVINYRLASYTLYGANYNQSSFEFPALDIQNINFKLTGGLATATINFAATPILNATITYHYMVDFYVNSTTDLILEFTSIHINEAPGNQSVASITVNNAKNVQYTMFTHIKTIPTQTSKNSVFWQLNLSSLNKTLSIEDLFAPNTLINHFISKYQYQPSFDASAESDYSFQGTGLKGQWSSYVKDRCSSEKVLTVNPYQVVAPILGILASIFILIGVLIRYRRPKIKYDLG